MPELKPALYLVATPIGHLDDLSARARQVLAEADLVCAEDTRHYRHLLQAAQIQPEAQRLLSVHAHNEAAQTDAVLKALGLGQRVAVVTDAGTPGIADPGQRLVDAAWAHGYTVVPIPGPSAMAAAFSICGFLPEDDRPWSFWGFLPARPHERKKRLESMRAVGGICLAFESPHRLEASLEDCIEVLGEATPALLAKEMTKRFETLWRGPLSSLYAKRRATTQEDPQAHKGEYVLVFAIRPRASATTGNQGDSAGTDIIHEAWQPWIDALADALPKTAAAKVIARATGLTRQEAYATLMRGQERED
ncbi:MAG: 16S rRNA (cytidine(1402)-2'-O)-methyltransferase [Burkholderiaceae bacterium]|jgi:16S rRNA (cytidine1402-2'-O)-methyltransferase